MLGTYRDILRYRHTWKFSAAGLILRLPMSMVGLSIILVVRSEYGNYTLAGSVSAINVIVMAICAPILARLVDRYGQLRVMGPAWTVATVSMCAFLACAALHAPEWTLFVPAAIAGATWGAPGALVRSRWSTILTKPGQLTTAYAFESAVDELVYILGPVLSTVLGTTIHPGTGLALSIVFLSVGGALFLSRRDSQPAIIPHDPRVHHESVIRKPVVLVMAATYIGMGTTFGANDVALVAFTEERGVPALSGVLLAVFSIGSLAAALVYGARSWRRPLWQLFAIGVVAMALGITTYLLAFNLWSLAIIILATGMTCAPTMTNVNMIIQKCVSAAKLTEGLTWMSTSINLGVSLGTALAGPAIDAGGSRGGFYCMLGAVWAMVVLMAVGLPTLRRSQSAPTRLLID
ncbi:MFS transporter [Schaalia meyeri]|uniref:MFS transporter n=1 Tax=Schaalia meyeri TaxID=52773 RepID=A0AAP9Y6Y5_9ACTO|nr:MFS transporter [Schaalia meyeri]QQC43519.1 MFS transporter [Schaalia meyeri]SDR95723.1 Predicted arabinose efflux permease, MFS family [Schaalia meyeri]